MWGGGNPASAQERRVSPNNKQLWTKKLGREEWAQLSITWETRAMLLSHAYISKGFEVSLKLRTPPPQVSP